MKYSIQIIPLRLCLHVETHCVLIYCGVTLAMDVFIMIMLCLQSTVERWTLIS